MIFRFIEDRNLHWGSILEVRTHPNLLKITFLRSNLQSSSISLRFNSTFGQTTFKNRYFNDCTRKFKLLIANSSKFNWLSSHSHSAEEIFDAIFLITTFYDLIKKSVEFFFFVKCRILMGILLFTNNRIHNLQNQRYL